MPIKSLVASNIDALERGAELIGSLNRNQYSSASSPVSSASVGSHMRHIAEHYQRFFSGLQSSLIDYDDRPRVADLESDKDLAASEMRRIINALGTLNGGEFALNDVMRVRLQSTHAAADTPIVHSTLGRELVFLHGHTTHHFAQLALQLRAIGVNVPRTFGMAPSTKSFEASLEQPLSLAANQKC